MMTTLRVPRRDSVLPPSSRRPRTPPFQGGNAGSNPVGGTLRCGYRGAVAEHGPVAQLVSAPPCHGGGRGFESRQGRRYGQAHAAFRPGSSVGMSVRLKSGRSAVRSRPWPPCICPVQGINLLVLLAELCPFGALHAYLLDWRPCGGPLRYRFAVRVLP